MSDLNELKQINKQLEELQNQKKTILKENRETGLAGLKELREKIIQMITEYNSLAKTTNIPKRLAYLEQDQTYQFKEDEEIPENWEPEDFGYSRVRAPEAEAWFPSQFC